MKRQKQKRTNRATAWRGWTAANAVTSHPGQDHMADRELLDVDTEFVRKDPLNKGG